MKNYHEIAERVAATIRKPKGAKALTEDQFMLMAGALAVELDLMRAQARAELIAEMEAAPVAYEVQRVYVWVPELFFNLPKAGVIEAKPLAYIPTKENHE